MSCTCAVCKRKYVVDVVVPDEIWDKIRPVGKSGGAGLLCGVCIFSAIEQIGSYSSYILKRTIFHNN